MISLIYAGEKKQLSSDSVYAGTMKYTTHHQEWISDLIGTFGVLYKFYQAIFFYAGVRTSSMRLNYQLLTSFIQPDIMFMLADWCLENDVTVFFLP